MAKVQGPLFSIEARGKLADAMVHFPWKNRNVVRKWLKPANPKTGAQGDARLILGGLGRACHAVHPKSQYATDGRVVADTGQSWVSALVKFTRATFMADAAAYEAMVGLMQASGVMGVLAEVAVRRGLADFDVDYKLIGPRFYNMLQVYMLGAYGCARYEANHAHFNRAPFTTPLANWTNAEVLLMEDLFPSL